MKITGSNEIYKTKLFTIKDVEIETKKGNKIFQIIEKQDSVVIFAINKQNEVYFVNEFLTAIGGYGVSLPGGRLDGNDNSAEVAQKELQEEVGFKAGKLEKLGVVTISPGYITQKTHLFLARELVPHKIEGDEVEELEIIKVPINQIEQMILRGVIHEARDISTYYLARNKLCF